MPIKGFFTQGLAVLTQKPLTPAAIDRALGSAFTTKHQPPQGDNPWTWGRPTTFVKYRPESNGCVVVDVVDQPWPDHMGDPKKEMALFAAWSMGFFGPGVFPGNLERALVLAANYGNDDIVNLAKSHRAFCRIRCTYVLGAGDKDPVIPDDYDALAELQFLTSVATALARADGALCYFNPNGEVLMTADDIAGWLDVAAEHDQHPLPVWAAARMFLPEDAPGWAVADVVGMEQLDAPDHEACYPAEDYDVNDVLAFVRDASAYTLANGGDIIKNQHTTDGPGGPWRALLTESTILPAPRPAIRWFPQSAPKPPPALLRTKSE